MPSVAILDRMTIVAGLDYQLADMAPTQAGPKWDYFTLSKALKSEGEEEAIRADVEQALQSKLQLQGYAEAATWM